MKNILGYTIFLTTRGWAGLVVDQEGLRLLILPEERKEEVVFKLKKDLFPLVPDDNFFKEEDDEIFRDLADKIKEYFRGKKVDFSDCPLNLEAYTNFQKKILQTVKKIPYGETRSYKEVAEAAGYPRAYRAVGNIMRNNPLPLIIPCHRVIKSDGSLGGFSARGGLTLKKKMIDWESVRK